MPYAPLLSAKAIEKLTKDHGYEPRQPSAVIVIAPAPPCSVTDPDARQVWLRSCEDFPHQSHLTRGWSKREALLEAQNHRCGYCGEHVFDGISTRAHNRATIDHVMPRAAGGIAIWSNEIIACNLCNQGRGAMFADRYFAKVEKVGRWKAHEWGIARQREASLRKPPVQVYY